MKYVDGQELKLGDRVKLDQDAGSVVVCLIDTGEYSEGYPKEQWGYLKKGAMINFPLYGLIHYEEELESDIQLIERAQQR